LLSPVLILSFNVRHCCSCRLLPLLSPLSHPVLPRPAPVHQVDDEHGGEEQQEQGAEDRDDDDVRRKSGGFRNVPLAVGADESVQAAALRVVLARPPVQLHVAAAPVLAPVVGAHHYRIWCDRGGGVDSGRPGSR